MKDAPKPQPEPRPLPEYRRPKLERVGSLRDLVGKTGPRTDGSPTNPRRP
jgi:hypothetical protein